MNYVIPSGDEEPAKTRGRRAVDAITCEACDSDEVRVRSSKGDRIHFMVCNACGHDWKLVTAGPIRRVLRLPS